MNIGERIRELRKSNGINQSTLAQVLRTHYGLGTDRVAVSKWETGYQMPNTDAVCCLAQYFGVTADYLMGCVNNNTAEKYVPVYRNKYEKGSYDGYAVLPYNCKADFCIIAPDDSMTNAGVVCGGTVFAKSQSTVGNGELAVVVIDGYIAVRRYYCEGNTIVLVCENMRNVPTIYNKSQNIEILGKAVTVQYDLK